MVWDTMMMNKALSKSVEDKGHRWQSRKTNPHLEQEYITVNTNSLQQPNKQNSQIVSLLLNMECRNCCIQLRKPKTDVRTGAWLRGSLLAGLCMMDWQFCSCPQPNLLLFIYVFSNSSPNHDLALLPLSSEDELSCLFRKDAEALEPELLHIKLLWAVFFPGSEK